MKNNPQSPTVPPVEEKNLIQQDLVDKYSLKSNDLTAPDESYGLIWPSETSSTAITFWCLAALGIIIAMFIKNLLLGGWLVGSSLTLLWMGHIVNYLKQIANKKV